MSGSQILADIIPNPTLLVKYDTNRGSWLDKPENLWGPCDWRSFMEGRILCKLVKTVKNRLTTAILTLAAKYLCTDMHTNSTFPCRYGPNEVTRADKRVGFKCISAYLASKLSVALSNHGFLQFYILTYTYKTVPITRHQESPRFINSRSSIGIILKWESCIWVLLCAIFASRDRILLVGCDFIVVNFEKLKKKPKFGHISACINRFIWYFYWFFCLRPLQNGV